MSRSIDYGNLMHRAMRGLIQEVLEDVADNGLPGSHHFFITFDTTHSATEIADWLTDRYPSEMTVVLQHWYDNLIVTDEGFGITLNFGDSPERLYIPYDAILTFVDPSVEFGLRFETQDETSDDDPEPSHSQRDSKDDSGNDSAKDQSAPDADIVQLDKFRK
ncbi:SspB family protein [Pseudooceanicola sp.]|uniref:SspB family protein n=1 Tax=Pseudooceanicola sp. TaxID=1914328 RepID=UPI000C09216E|nr:hypothetical protein [Pseudooceanicola sp.]